MKTQLHVPLLAMYTKLGLYTNTCTKLQYVTG